MDPDSAQCENVNMAPIKKTLRPISRTFLQEWRDFIDLDQEEVAARIDMSRSNLSKIENGESPYTQRTLEALAEVYGREPWELIAIDPNNEESLWALFKQADKLTGRDRKRLREVIIASLS